MRANADREIPYPNAVVLPEVLIFAVAALLSALVGGSAGFAAASHKARQAAFSVYDELEHAIAQERTRTAALRDEAGEFYERAERARARAAAAEGGRASGRARAASREEVQDGDIPDIASPEQYVNYLNGGGTPNPVVERRLGI